MDDFTHCLIAMEEAKYDDKQDDFSDFHASKSNVADKQDDQGLDNGQSRDLNKGLQDMNETSMEDKMREDFERMQVVYAYLKKKRSGDKQLYPPNFNQKEKDSLRRYANNYELDGTLHSKLYQMLNLLNLLHLLPHFDENF